MTHLPKPNEPLVTHIYTADPSAHVYEGKSTFILPMTWITMDRIMITGTSMQWKTIIFCHWITLNHR